MATWRFSADRGYADTGEQVIRTDDGWDAYAAETSAPVGCFQSREQAIAAAEMTTASLKCCQDNG